jgi:hypothetical protein
MLRLSLLLLLLLAPACASGPASTVHGSHNLSINTMVMDNTDWSRGLEGFSGDVDFPADTGITALQYEYFLGAASSMIFSLEKRDYAIDVPGGDAGDSTEFGWAGRFYGRTDERLQFFGQLGMRFGPGVEWDAGIDSDLVLGFDLGGGARYFFEAGPFLDFRLAYDITIFNTDVGIGVDVQDRVDGLIGLIGLGWSF